MDDYYSSSQTGVDQSMPSSGARRWESQTTANNSTQPSSSVETLYIIMKVKRENQR